MKLGPSAYLLLGMLRTGASSGYAIKKLADVSTRFFWPTSLAAVYPELARLEREVDLAKATAAALQQGVWLRPFRDLIYAMPPYTIEADELAKVTEAMLAAARAG